MNQTNTLIGLHAQTSIHAGTGQNTGVIDLPIQREGHNGWPCVFGSAVKGALRTRAEDEYRVLKDGKERIHECVSYVFGPDTSKAHEHAGAIAISDARLLLLPVRSLTSQFKWVTCPAALSRLVQDAKRFGKTINLPDIPIDDNNPHQALITNGQNKADIFLEEYRFTPEEMKLDALLDVLVLLMNQVSKETLAKQLVIINDDNFTHMAQHVTPVNAHIAIDSDTKIVKPGALWYEETLPPETVLYVGVSAVNARKQEDGKPAMDASQIMGAITGLFTKQPWLQLGGNETVGMGWCAISEFPADNDGGDA
jgi:CRISPR-associated protein Cmr4